MNKIKYLLIVLIAAFIYSCAEDDFENPPAPANFNNVAQVVVDGVDNDPAVLLKSKENDPWDTIAWIPAQLYEGEGLVTHYTVQIDEQGNNFASAIEFQSNSTSDTSIVITQGTLNSRLLANGFSPVQSYDLEYRIKSFVHKQLDSLYSEVFSFTVTTYRPDVPVPESLYLFGDATTVGWGADTSLAMYNDEDKYVVFTYLEKDKKFRFLKAQNTDDNTYDFDSFITIPETVKAAKDEDNNFIFKGNTGWYKIEADYITSTLSIAQHVVGSETYTYTYENLYLVGDYNSVDGEWDYDNAVAFTKVGEDLFTITRELKDASEFKFIGQQADGDLQWGNIGEEGNSGILGPKDYNGDITFDGGNNSYIIEVNIKEGTYSLTKDIPKEIWLVGSINGWNNYGQYLAAIGNDVHVGYQYLEDVDEIKILVERSSWDGLWGAGATAGTIADGGDNIKVAEIPTYDGEGFYEIKFDLANKTVVLTPVAIGVIGSAQAGDWSTDVNLTFNTATNVWEGQVDFFATGEWKFRANDDWVISFGGVLDNIEYNGGNLATPGAGTYDVVLDISGQEKFFATVTVAK
ncbi:MAG: SusF/SusE family outer membrane protein [Bacteroidetes bacterium]|nr:SusF/SusE family outer membrane protein [Bacteroidota bacterium]